MTELIKNLELILTLYAFADMVWTFVEKVDKKGVVRLELSVEEFLSLLFFVCAILILRLFRQLDEYLHCSLFNFADKPTYWSISFSVFIILLLYYKGQFE